MSKLKELWANLAKPVKVLIYLSISQVLGQVVADLSNISEPWVKYVVSLVNLLIVLVAYAKDEVEKRLSK